MTKRPGPRLSPRLQIRSGAGDPAPGLLGAILYDPETTTLYGLTALQLLELGVRLVSASPGQDEIAIDDGLPQTYIKSTPEVACADLVAAVPLIDAPLDDELLKYQTASGREALSLSAKIIRDPWDVIGDTVAVTVQTGDTRLARVASVEGRFSMPHPNGGQITTFVGAIKLRSLDGAPLATLGDAGGLVTTLRGDWLAIVVAGDGDIAFAAPLAPTVERLGLAPLTHAQIQAYNRGGDLHVKYNERTPVPIDLHWNANPDEATPQTAADEAGYILFADRERAR